MKVEEKVLRLNAFCWSSWRRESKREREIDRERKGGGEERERERERERESLKALATAVKYVRE
jgi:hypothetical protein